MLAIIIVGAGLLGAGTLLDLAVALGVGMAAGTYSSIFIATPFLDAADNGGESAHSRPGSPHDAPRRRARVGVPRPRSKVMP